MKRLFVLILWPLLLGACNAYHPLKGGIGYTEVPIGRGSFQVTFAGDSDMSVTETRQYCLTRAAELAVLSNAPYFEITNEHIYVSYGSEYVPGADYGYIGYGHRRDYHYGYAYDPGYTELYSVPEVMMQIALQQQLGKSSIPAAYLILQAVTAKVPLTPGVAERASQMPSGPASIPPPPPPTTRPVA
jgi:hypothetical protein